MIVVAIIGILAAIAIPQYQNYTARAQMSEAMTLAGGARTAVTEVYQTTGDWPQDNDEAGLEGATSITGKYVLSVTVGPASGASSSVITALLKDESPVVNSIRGESLVLAASDEGGSVSWECTSTADPQLVPTACRGE